jgi:hypothetical protein
MIKQIQNIYLLVVATLLLPVHFLSLWTANINHITNDDNEWTALIVRQHLSVDVPLLAAIAFCLIAIFTFSNSKLQLRLIKASLCCLIFFGLSTIYVVHNLKLPLAPDQVYQQEYNLTLLLPIVATILLILAMNVLWKQRAIEKSINK